MIGPGETGLKLPVRGTLIEPSQLHNAATGYIQRGWSIIPTEGKRPVVAWKAYQTRHANERELYGWFGASTGLAVLTGSISNLAILDFDDPGLYTRFCEQQPHLASTYTVKTRRGYHLYFGLPSNYKLETRRGSGFDLLVEGCYAVTAPSPGYEYIGGQVVQLRGIDVIGLNAFLDGFVPVQPERGRAIPDPIGIIPLAPQQLVSIYKALAPAEGRNNALFKVACQGRDSGLTMEQVMEALVDVHVQQPANGAHRRDYPAARRREAQATIRSTFSRPPRNQPHQTTEVQPGIAASVAEALVVNKLTCVLRVLSALRHSGVEPGEAFTRKQAWAILQGTVGDFSLRRALAATGQDEEPLISATLAPSPDPTQTTVASDRSIDQTPCGMFSSTEPTKNATRGRPAVIYTMPSDDELAQRLGVVCVGKPVPMPQSCVSSPRQTRQCVHRELFARRPGQYTRAWLARRLNLSGRTIQRYHAADPTVLRDPIYERKVITWHTLRHIPDELPHGGFFLEDGQGKRYPAKAPIARKLLSRRETVVLCRERPSYYRVCPAIADERVPIPKQIEVQHTETERESHNFRQPHISIPPPPPEWVMQANQPQTSAQYAPVTMQRVQQRREKAKQYNLRRRLPDHLEAAAETVYEAINAMMSEDEFSLVSARRLIVRYGRHKTLDALKRVQARRHVSHSPGLLSTILRSEGSDESDEQKHQELLLHV